MLFENLELVRTLRATGARAGAGRRLFVERRPPTVRRYLDQRVRQAYDELARPARLAAQLLLAPAMIAATRRFGVRAWPAFALASIGAAEAGRRRGRGVHAFQPAALGGAPAWLAERAATAWIALALRGAGGVRYSNGRLRIAANSERALRARYGGFARAREALR